MPEKFGNSAHRNFGGFLIGEMELPSGDTAKRYAFQSMCCRQIQTGAVTGSQFLTVTLSHLALDDRADGVKDIFCREIIPLCQLGASVRFRVSLPAHDFIAFISELETCR